MCAIWTQFQIVCNTHKGLRKEKIVQNNLLLWLQTICIKYYITFLFFPIFWRVPRSRSLCNNNTYNIVHNTLSSLKKVHFCSSHIIWGDFFHNLLFVFIFYQKKYQLSIIETILDTYFILNNSASFHFNGQTCIPYTKEKNLITH